MKLSAIICTHNPREDYLKKTLGALRGQTLPKNKWELILVDNASKEPLAGKWDLSWHPKTRIVREDKLGLTAARLRGIEEAGGENLVFVDDDNELAPDYLELAVSIAARLPNIGCFGAGNIIPEYEVPPDPEVLPFTPMLALRQSTKDKWSNHPDDNCVPWGAGLVVQKKVAHQHVINLKTRNERIQLDRSGQELNSCGDSDFSWTACYMGLGKGTFSNLQVKHLIPKTRIEKAYLFRIAEGHGFSHALLRAFHGKEIQKSDSPGRFFCVLSTLLKLQFSCFVRELQKWNSSRGHTKMQKQIAHYWNRGNDRAVLFVKEVLKNSTTKAQATLKKDKT